MRAIRYDAYGGLEQVKLGELPEPRLGTGPLVRVKCAALNPKDSLFRKGKFALLSGRKFPKQCGLDFAGVVEREGGGLSVGTPVFGALNEWTFRRGTLAELVAPDAHEVAAIPPGVDAADAASIALVGLTALQALRDVARIAPGADVLINGASGGVGTVAIQLARVLGAKVSTVSSDEMRAFCTSLGSQEALAYSTLPEVLASRRFDTVFDVFGNLRFGKARGALKKNGVFVSTVPSLGRVVSDRLSRWSSHQERLVIVTPRRDDLDQLGAWLREGKLRAVIDSRFPLSDFAAAFGKLESKHTHGKIVIEL
ncbi:MAG: NAD(P)-dependent alcohol dehydrogenase [Archangium sp.]|nr:NAD(P)-dependent alcohol dehydrogenase [Archangium sp.]